MGGVLHNSVSDQRAKCLRKQAEVHYRKHLMIPKKNTQTCDVTLDKESSLYRPWPWPYGAQCLAVGASLPVTTQVLPCCLDLVPSATTG